MEKLWVADSGVAEVRPRSRSSILRAARAVVFSDELAENAFARFHAAAFIASAFRSNSAGLT